MGVVGMGDGGGGIGDMCFVYMGRKSVLELVGCFCLGSIGWGIGISKCIEVTLAFSVITKRRFDIPSVSICP